MRDRLIELLNQNCGYVEEQKAENLADYLLENGVIALPNLEYKQSLYIIYNNKIKTLQVTSFQIRPEFNNLLQIHLYKDGFNGCCTVDDFGKTVFLTKEEAEKALKGGDREC